MIQAAKANKIYAALKAELFEVRKAESNKIIGMHPYMIFDGPVLEAMAKFRPSSMASLLALPTSVASNKAQMYGDVFLSKIRDFCSSHPDGPLATDLHKKQSLPSVSVSSSASSSLAPRSDFIDVSDSPVEVVLLHFMFITSFFIS